LNEPPPDCRCMTPPFMYWDFDAVPVGVDGTKGRGGEVTLETCKACGSLWLRYFVEYEFFSQSGRWYRGLVTPEVVESLTPERAPELLQNLPWLFSGGSYFRSTGRRSTCMVILDI